MTEQAAIAVQGIEKNVGRIAARFRDPSVRVPYEDDLVTIINNTIVTLLQIRDEAKVIDLGGVLN